MSVGDLGNQSVEFLMSRNFSLLIRLVFCVTIVFSSIAAATSAHGQSVGHIGISSVDAARIGLKVEWESQVNVAAAAGRIVDIWMDVNEDRAQTYFEITYGGKRELISVLDNSAFGRPYGANPAIFGMEKGLKRRIELMLTQGNTPTEIQNSTDVDEETIAHVQKEMLDRVTDAGEAAEIRRDVLQGLMNSQNREVTVELKKLTLPTSTLYVTTTTGFVQAIDADTGLTHWTNSVGSSTHPTIGLGASHDHVAVVNGSTLYCLNAENGKQIWSRRRRAAVGASPVVGKNLIFVPLVNGRLEAFPIENGLGSESFVSTGNANTRPTITEDSIAWATSKGQFTVASNREVNSPHYRLKSGSSFGAPATANNGILFIGATDGFAYAIDEIRGSLMWEFSTGQTIRHSMIPLGEYVYVITEERKLFKLFAKTGRPTPGWSVPVDNIKSYVGASQNKIYLVNNQDQIVALSQNTGDLLGTLKSDATALILPNLLSDRLYVGNRFGQIQCLRELSSPTPVFLGDEMMADKPVEGAPSPDQGSATKPDQGSGTK